jgi:hypothetical protein
MLFCFNIDKFQLTIPKTQVNVFSNSLISYKSINFCRKRHSILCCFAVCCNSQECIPVKWRLALVYKKLKQHSRSCDTAHYWHYIASLIDEWMNKYGVLVKWYWQGQSKVLKAKKCSSATSSTTIWKWHHTIILSHWVDSMVRLLLHTGHY